MHVQAYVIALLSFLLPCVSASRVRPTATELFVPQVPGVRLQDARRVGPRNALEPEQGPDWDDNRVPAIKVPRELQKVMEDKDRQYQDRVQLQLQREAKERQWENQVRDRLEDNVGEAIFQLREDVASMLTLPGNLSTIFLEDVTLTDKAGDVLATGKTEYASYFEELRRAVGQASLNENFTKPVLTLGDVRARFFGTQGPSSLWKNDITVKFAITQNRTALPEDEIVAFKCISVYKVNPDGIIKEHEINDNLQRAVKHFQELGRNLF